MANNIIRRLDGPNARITVEETFSDSPYPDNRFLYIVRSQFKDGDKDAVIGYYDLPMALHDFKILVAVELEELPV